MKQRHIDNSYGIFLMWWYWTLSSGVLISLIVLSLWVKPLYLPFVAFGLDLILFSVIRKNRQAKVPSCYLIPFICARALFWSAVVMVAINFLTSPWFINRIFDMGGINRQIPFITQLIVAPITLAIAVWANMREYRLGICRDCKRRFGTPSERGFLGMLFTQEGRFQNRLLIFLAAFSTIATWSYYFLSYANDELNRTDKFFFVWCTAIVYLIAVVYCLFRYLGLWSYYCRKEENVSLQAITMTEVRYIIFWDNFVCLKSYRGDSDGLLPDQAKMDTPVKLNLSFRSDVTLFDARRYFTDLTGMKDAEVRFMYSTLNTNADCNIFHYLVFLDDAQKEKLDSEDTDCRWYTLSEIAGFINTQKAAPLFSSEIVRLHTMAMAWKTYDEEGFRRYKIKHYRPTYRFRDVKTYNLDYNDPLWLYVDDNNEDRPFFRLRRLWRKYFNGMNS